MQTTNRSSETQQGSLSNSARPNQANARATRRPPTWQRHLAEPSRLTRIGGLGPAASMALPKRPAKSNTLVAAGLVAIWAGMALFPLFYTRTGPQVRTIASIAQCRRSEPSDGSLAPLGAPSTKPLPQRQGHRVRTVHLQLQQRIGIAIEGLRRVLFCRRCCRQRRCRCHPQLFTPSNTIRSSPSAPCAAHQQGRSPQWTGTFSAPVCSQPAFLCGCTTGSG